MNKQKLFRKAVWVGILTSTFALGACTATDNEEGWLSDEDVVFAETGTQAEKAIPVESEAACLSDDEEACLLSDEYLTGKFVQTEMNTATEKTDLPLFEGMESEETIALSRPAGAKAIAVKDKQAAKQSTADRVLYSSQAIPETVQKTEEVTEVTSKTTVNAKTVEKVELPKEESGVVAAESLETAISVPGQMVPLKKVKTTITETTTKVKKEPKEKVEYDFKKMTLKEKVEYGESQQEWEAVAGNTLRGLLMDWGEKAGWTVVWKLDRDYHLEAGVIFQGTFTEVSSALIRSFARATPAPIGTFYQGNRVLVVNTQEDENER